MSRSTDFIPFARPTLGRREEKAVLSVMRSGWLTTGAQALAFEADFAAYCGVEYALAVSSATAGLHLSLDALDLPPESYVATTPYTFAASAEVVRYIGCHPLFVDIEAESYNLDPVLLRDALEKHRDRVKAVLPVHIAGLPCDMPTLGSLCRERGLPVVEDAAHCFPVRSSCGFIGTCGETGVFSFYANKTITTGEGGLIVTNRADLARRMTVMRLHGIDRDSWQRYTARNAGWDYRIVAAGYKYNMSDLAAAIGRIQLTRAEKFLGLRRNIARRYIHELEDCDFLDLPPYREDHAWHLFMVRLGAERLRISRDEFARKLAEEGIGVSVHYRPLHMMPYYRKRYGFKPKDFPVAFDNYRRSISLPIYPSLRGSEIGRIVETVRKIGYTFHRRRHHAL